MDKMLNFLPEKKTYLIGLGMIVVGLISGVAPEAMTAIGLTPVEGAKELMAEGFGLMFLRKGIAGAVEKITAAK